jgi:hypothetical protein
MGEVSVGFSSKVDQVSIALHIFILIMEARTLLEDLFLFGVNFFANRYNVTDGKI